MLLNKQAIQFHQQIHPLSCIPMSIECVLKMLGIMPINNFDLQKDESKHLRNQWLQNVVFRGPDSKGVTFTNEYPQFGHSRNDENMRLYFDELFHTIDDELSCNRYVIISLSTGPNQWHMVIVYDKLDESNYDTVTFNYGEVGPQLLRENLKERVRKMKGTDILTYKFV